MDVNTTLNDSYLVRQMMPEPPAYIFILASVFYSLTFVIGFIGNIFVVTLVFGFKRMQSRMNYFFVNLSITDMLILLVCMPSATVDLFAKEVWYFGEFMCKMVHYTENVLTLASVMTILAITADRFKGICHPILSKGHWTNIRVSVVIAIVWILAIVCSLPTFFFPVFKDSTWVDGTPIKVCRIPINKEWKVGFLLAIFILFFAIPFFVLAGLIFCMGRALLWQHNLQEGRADKEALYTLNKRRRVVVMLILVVVAFFLCLLPQRILGLWIIFTERSNLASLGLEGYLNLVTFTRVMVYINSAMNPVIYNCMSTKFRGALKDLCYRRRHYNSISRTHAITLTTIPSSGSCHSTR
ncbi:growth hormone secretagogue receptor type 1-like [Saccostrea cucullata]|uniref:growth hormone secretagogue receptor type 1-like n=1 Tax=Saccostrea cuccullata TaxID=36930 RepID=UPI002ED2C5E7